VTDWEACKDCGGARVQGEHCLAHLTDCERLQEINRLRDGGALDARGAHFDPGTLHAVLAAFQPDADRPFQLPPSDFTGAHFAGDVTFDRAQFSGTAIFDEAQFSGNATFIGVQFSHDIGFKGTLFSGNVWFDGGTQFRRMTNFNTAQFLGYAGFENTQFMWTNFDGTQFSGNVNFSRAQFSRSTHFSEARFSAHANFHDARFSGYTSFDRVQFSDFAGFQNTQFSDEASFFNAQWSHMSFHKARLSGDARFDGAQFSGYANFEQARFSSDAHFGASQFSSAVGLSGAQFSRDLSFDKCVFRHRVTVGPLVVSGTLSFDDADFEQDVQLDASACSLSCHRTRFAGRADLNVRWAEIALDDATFVQPSRLAGVIAFSQIDDRPAQLCRVDRRLDANQRPRLMSVRQANVEYLALGNIDLRACRFAGAHGLDQLRIEADCNFAQPPHPWRYAQRRTLAEEQHWRHCSASHGKSDWHPPVCQSAYWLAPEAQVLDPPRIASLYRALRKSLEDRKDEPGAADFYYGEMEMRRRGAGMATRVILTLYWLVSGYGLRASRALLALVLTIVLAAVALSRWGLHPGGPYHGYGRSLLLALDSSISVLRAPTTVGLSAGGQITEIILRLAGPLFFGLALLSVRGRVKR
jgi:hypothetical protein